VSKQLGISMELISVVLHCSILQHSVDLGIIRTWTVEVLIFFLFNIFFSMINLYAPFNLCTNNYCEMIAQSQNKCCHY
jgi:hypothetical protein